MISLLMEDLHRLLDDVRNAFYDEGYLDGVRDARLTPRIADETIEVIMAEQASAAAERTFSVRAFEEHSTEDVFDTGDSQTYRGPY